MKKKKPFHYRNTHAVNHIFALRRGKHEFKGNLRKFKEGLKGEKKGVEPLKTVA